jgi:hypothetical protein
MLALRAYSTLAWRDSWRLGKVCSRLLSCFKADKHAVRAMGLNPEDRGFAT